MYEYINYGETCLYLIYAFSYLVLPSLYYYYYYLFDNDHVGKCYFACSHLNLNWLCYPFVLIVYYYRMSSAYLHLDCLWVIRSCSRIPHSNHFLETRSLTQLFLDDYFIDFAWIWSGCHSLHSVENVDSYLDCRI